MTVPRLALDMIPGWAWLRSGVGYHLDNFGRWLMGRAPALGAIYASWWVPGPPHPGVRPGWRFAEELYPRRLWPACRRGVLWEAARQHGLNIPLSVRWHGGTRVDVTLGNDNSLCLYVCGSFEPNEFAFLDRTIEPGMTFIDVGANDGYYALFAAVKVGAAGRVVAVEPSSRERAHLQRNLERNTVGNVTVVATALGAVDGFTELILADGLHAGHNTLGEFAHGDVAVAGTERVLVETLDGLAARLELARVDLVKIDVEGAEGAVLAGARQVISSWRPILLLEVDDGALRAQGHSADSLFEALLSEFRYEIFVYSEINGRPERWTQGAPISANIVGVPAERLDSGLRV